MMRLSFQVRYFRLAHWAIGGAEINRLVGKLPDTAARADWLIIKSNAGH